MTTPEQERDMRVALYEMFAGDSEGILRFCSELLAVTLMAQGANQVTLFLNDFELVGTDIEQSDWTVEVRRDDAEDTRKLN